MTADPTPVPDGEAAGADLVATEEEVAAAEPVLPAALIRREERLPPNLFLVSAPGVVLFPDLTAPVVLREAWAERTVAHAQTQSGVLGFVVQGRAAPSEHPPPVEEVSAFGCLVRIHRILQMPDGTRTILAQGVARFRVTRFLRTEPYLIAKVAYPPEVPGTDDEAEALARNVRDGLRHVLEATPGAGEEMGIAALNIERKGALADFAGAYFVKDSATRAALLEELDVKSRLRRVNEELLRERRILELGNRIQEEIREKLEKRQHEFFLREQLKAIRRELGEEQDERTLSVDSLRQRLSEVELPDEVRTRAEEEIRRLAVLPPESPEAGLLRTYVEWIVDLPFGKETQDTRDLRAASAVLDRDHAGLQEIKERILEFLAVRQRVREHKGQILCFVGPPGVGKTSLGRSIAEALGRRFVRVSLGGVHDEAEIRGHRRTYIGAIPGRIVRGLKTAGTMNPVFVLDELDKVGQDFRGDPSSALLEVLDPEQNHQFSDHYLEVPLDLSKVFFIATANQLETVPPALRDRLEVIEMSGYVTEEKLEIARRYLIPKQLRNHGLKRGELSIAAGAVRLLIEEYTREAGVRSLEKNVARLCRKAVTRIAREEDGAVRVGTRNLADFLGPPPFPRQQRRRSARPGVALGLAWTPVGGEVLEVQAMLIPEARKGLEVTGMLGEVMAESAHIAVSYVLGHDRELGLERPGKTTGLHVHVPAGAVRKDGPSAGVTIATALVSLLSGATARRDLAMTGELTLTGQVLAVGGIRDKILAARRHGLSTVVLPRASEKDVIQIPPELVKGMTFHFVEDYSEIVPLVFSPGRAGRRSRPQRGVRSHP